MEGRKEGRKEGRQAYPTATPMQNSSKGDDTPQLPFLSVGPGLDTAWAATRGGGGGPRWLLWAGQGFHTSVARPKAKAARIRSGKGIIPVTYEEAHPPHYIAHRKGWLSQHTSHLCGEEGAAERAVEDVFIRKFIYGTFHGCLANEIVLKRRANMLIICAVFVQKMLPHKLYFLIGYTEVLLSYLYKCPVKMEVQTVPEKVIYKYV
uniref:Small ribosomal subunit protein uS3m isoform X2 n=1 Tax=Pogona vitticeps TaxID=103695 RepID=A0ABM5EPT8_9SAUR